MKKTFQLAGFTLASAALLAACGEDNNTTTEIDNNGGGNNVNNNAENNTEDDNSNDENNNDENENNDDNNADNTNGENESAGDMDPLNVGATNVPHAEVLEFAQPLLEDEGVELEITTFNDYILPNQALDEGELDANYFQHVPYLESQMDEFDYDFANAGEIHVEPIGIYSQDYDSLSDLPEGALILMSDSVADQGRILNVLETEGLIELDEDAGIEATIEDIEENPNDFEFQANVEAALLPTAYENNEADAIQINSNYALDAGLNPVEDPIASEEVEDNPYFNVIAVQSEDEGDERIETLVDVLRSEEVKDFIDEEYEGSVVHYLDQ